MKRAAVVGIAAGTVALVLGGSALAWWLSTRAPSLEDTAHTYLQALADGDVDTIASLVPAEDRERIEPAIDAFAGASASITEFTIEAAAEESTPGLGGGRARVVLDGSPGVVFFGFELVDGRWMLGSDVLSSVTVSAGLGDTVGVGGALFPLHEPVGLFPGVYEFTAAPTGLLSGSATVAVTNEEPLTVEIDATLAPAATAAAQEQLDAYASACTRPAAEVPVTCGIRVPWPADFASLDRLAFRIDALPVVSLSADARSFDATGGVLVATATGTTLAGTSGSVTYRTDDWALRGSVAFAGDEMVLSVR